MAEGVCIVPNFLNTYTFCLTLTALLTNTQTNKAGQRPSTLNLSATTAALQVSSLPSLVPPFPPSCNDLPNVCCVIAQNLPVFFVFCWTLSAMSYIRTCKVFLRGAQNETGKVEGIKF